MTTIVQSGIASWEPQAFEATGLAHAIGLVRGGWSVGTRRSARLRPTETFTVRLVSFDLSGAPSDEALREQELSLGWEQFLELVPTPQVVARAQMVARPTLLPPLAWDF